jgi:hypothetical protein
MIRTSQNQDIGDAPNPTAVTVDDDGPGIPDSITA